MPIQIKDRDIDHTPWVFAVLHHNLHKNQNIAYWLHLTDGFVYETIDQDLHYLWAKPADFHSFPGFQHSSCWYV